MAYECAKHGYKSDAMCGTCAVDEIAALKVEIAGERAIVRHLTGLLEEMEAALMAPNDCEDHACNVCTDWCLRCREGNSGREKRSEALAKVGLA